MADTPPGRLLDPDALRRVERLEVLARQVVEGTLTGLHRSPFHGYSIEFLQHRPYVPGDDIRRLDWKVLARTDRDYVRQFEDETNLRATIVLDASGSMDYGSRAVTKLHYAVRLAAVLAYLLIEQQDSVGLVVLDAGARSFLPPRRGRRQLQALLDELEGVAASGETALADVLHGLSSRVPPRGLVLVLSDFFVDVEPLLNALAHLRSVHHEIVLLQVLDRREMDFELEQWTRFECLEDPATRLLLDPAQVRATYVDRFTRFQSSLREGCRRHRVDLATLPTDTPYDAALARYLAARGGRT